MNKRYLIAILLAAVVLTGFFRESVFENINAHMWYLYYDNDRSHLPSWLWLIGSLSYSQLYWLKWILTILFSALFLGMSCGIIHLIFDNKEMVKWTVYFYSGILLIAFVSFLSGKISGKMEEAYLISRFFMGLIQSPFLLVFLIPAYQLVKPSAQPNN